MSLIHFLGDRPSLMLLALVLAEVTVVTTIAMIALRLAKRDASTRYGIGVATLILVALSLPVTLIIQRSGLETVAWTRTVALSSEPVSQAITPASPTPIWVWLWIAGSAAFFLRIVLGIWRVQRQRRQATAVEKVNGVQVCLTDGVGPAVVGVRKPAVLVPRELLKQLSEDELRSVLIHEFEHVAHRHLAVAFFQRLVAGVFWPHPLIHLINRQIVLAREEVCDNAVLRSAGAARFARVLLRVAECRQGPRQFSASMGLFDPPTSLEERVKGLLDPNRRIDSKMNRRSLFLASLALSLGAAAVAGARIQTEVMLDAAHDGYGLRRVKQVTPKPLKPAPTIRVKAKPARTTPLRRGQTPPVIRPREFPAPEVIPPLKSPSMPAPAKGTPAPIAPPRIRVPGQSPIAPLPPVGAPSLPSPKEFPAPAVMPPVGSPAAIPPPKEFPAPSAPNPSGARAKAPAPAPAGSPTILPPKEFPAPAVMPPVGSPATIPPPKEFKAPAPAKRLRGFVPPEVTQGPVSPEQKSVPILRDIPIISHLFRAEPGQGRERKIQFLSDLPILGKLFIDRCGDSSDATPPPAVSHSGL